MRKRKIKKKVIQKAPFFIFADKILENVAMLNKYSECPNCKNEIKKTQIICEKCGQELGNKRTYEENLNYIRAYLHDKMYTQTEILQKLDQEIKTLKEIAKDVKLKSGYEICQKCNGTGIITVSSPLPLNIKHKCPKCKGERIIETNRSIII